MKKSVRTVIIFLVVAFALMSMVSALNIKENLKKIFTENKNQDYFNEKIQMCINENMDVAIDTLLVQGGSLDPEKYLIASNSKIAYGYYDNKNILPLKKDIENELKWFMDGVLLFCISQEIEDLNNLDITNTKVLIKKDRINFRTKILTEINGTRISNTYYYEKSVSLYSILEIAKKIIEHQALDKENVDIEYLNSLETDIIISPYSENEIIYSILYEDSLNELYTFRFAVKV